MAKQKTKVGAVEDAVLTANELLETIVRRPPPHFYSAAWFEKQWGMPYSSAQRWCERLVNMKRLRCIVVMGRKFYGPVLPNAEKKNSAASVSTNRANTHHHHD